MNQLGVQIDLFLQNAVEVKENSQILLSGLIESKTLQSGTVDTVLIKVGRQ